MIELQKHLATCTATGKEIEIKQWRVFLDGNLVGYLPHVLDSELMPITGFPLDRLDELVAECQVRRRELEGGESIVKSPPEYQTRFLKVYDLLKEKIEAEEETEVDEDE